MIRMGVDYPIGYVRWTEQRNMHQFLNLVAQKKVIVDKLITHRFKIDDVEQAYDIITGKTKEKHIGILLEYPQERAEKIQKTVWLPTPSPSQEGSLRTESQIIKARRLKFRTKLLRRR